MQYLAPFFYFFSNVAVLAPNTYTPSPPKTAVGYEFGQTFSYYQLVFLAIMVSMGITRCLMTIEKEDTPERRVRPKRHMTFCLVFGIGCAVVQLAMLFWFEPPSQIRYTISTLLEFLQVLVFTWFGMEYCMTCSVEYNWLIIPTIITCSLTYYGFKRIGRVEYYSLYLIWNMCIFSGLLELWLMWRNGVVNSFIYDISMDNIRNSDEDDDERRINCSKFDF
ncbi:hypothetical protein GCK72_016102 [Caenorhabditis remanei]|uniref:Uncharacterized protein n=1 Tax=Caenorhabditis remanei TaxID=31234 RepID=A0A6A5GYK2_CAERE|nr:hypothetical protein GCK72_016102 [Caenorhabditis remanei]KAF1759635.1 hypothetical protein GCK72_016102 [Caenorhabditis remanei]